MQKRVWLTAGIVIVAAALVIGLSAAGGEIGTPLGGMAFMAGWIALALGAVLPLRRR